MQHGRSRSVILTIPKKHSREVSRDSNILNAEQVWRKHLEAKEADLAEKERKLE